MKLDDHELPRLGFSLEEDKEEVGRERKAQNEAELLPPTPDITAVRTATAGADTEAECKGYTAIVTPIYLHLLLLPRAVHAREVGLSNRLCLLIYIIIYNYVIIIIIIITPVYIMSKKDKTTSNILNAYCCKSLPRTVNQILHLPSSLRSNSLHGLWWGRLFGYLFFLINAPKNNKFRVALRNWNTKPIAHVFPITRRRKK